MLLNATSNPGADTIKFQLPAGFDTIVLGPGSNQGDLLINDPSTLVIDTEGQAITIDAGGGTNGVVGNGDGFRAFHITSGDVTLRGLTITGGDVNGMDEGGFGGGVLMQNLIEDGSLTLDGVKLVDNYAEQGGGLYSFGGDVEITNSLIADNTGRDSGGGASLLHAGSVKFEDTRVLRNQTTAAPGDLNGSQGAKGSGGGIAIRDNVLSAEVTRTVVADNTATFNGGGIFAQYGNGVDFLNIRYSSIYENTALEEGGGVYFCPKRGGELYVTNTTVADNVLTAADGRGGGVFVGAETDIDAGRLDVYLTQVTITGNEAQHGAGLFGFRGVRPGEFGNPSPMPLDIEMHNSIIAENNGNSDVDAEFVPVSGGTPDNQLFETESSHNLVGTLGTAISTELTGNSNLTGVGQAQLQLGELSYNGGFSLDFFTVPFLPDGPVSLAIDAGSNDEAFDPTDSTVQLMYDQRGQGNGMTQDFVRRYDSELTVISSTPTVDIGAYEDQPIFIDLDDPSEPPLPPLTQLIFVTIEDDEIDCDLTIDDISLREAVQFANSSSRPVVIVLPAGTYPITRYGTESNDASFNDLDITSNVTINGAGPGLSVIEATGTGVSGTEGELRLFAVNGTNSVLDIDGVTLTGVEESAPSSSGFIYSAGGIEVRNGGTLTMTDSVLVANSGEGAGTGILASNSDVTVLRSVFTSNSGVGATAIYASAFGGTGSLTIGESIFALNQGSLVTPNVYAFGSQLTRNNLGKNLYDDAAGGFFDTNPGVDDHLGATDYVVTTIADTFDHGDDSRSLSIREAIDLANGTSGAEEVWLPAWDFTLTRDRGTNATDTEVGYGDLDIKDRLTVRGVKDATTVGWKAGINDAVFDLLGDYNDPWAMNQEANIADDTIWRDQLGSGSGTADDWEAYAADGNDDGQVDAADRDLWIAYFDNSLDLFDVMPAAS